MENEQATDTLHHLIDTYTEDDDSALRVGVREAELHELVEIHRMASAILDEAEGEMAYRNEYGIQLASGDDEDREYVADEV